MGLTVGQKDGKGYYITCKSNNPIRAYDKNGEVMEGIGVGNGSQSVALVSFYDWSWKNKAGRSPSLKKLVVTDLVSFEGDVGEESVSMDDGELL
jgi:hypothetical protein